MAEKKSKNLVSYIALGVSVVALVVASLNGNPKRRPRHEFCGEPGSRQEMMGCQRYGDNKGPMMGKEVGNQPNAKPGLAGQRAGQPKTKAK